MRRPGTVHYGSRRLPAAVYFVPAFVDSVSPLPPTYPLPAIRRPWAAGFAWRYHPA